MVVCGTCSTVVTLAAGRSRVRTWTRSRRFRLERTCSRIRRLMALLLTSCAENDQYDHCRKESDASQRGAVETGTRRAWKPTRQLGILFPLGPRATHGEDDLAYVVLALWRAHEGKEAQIAQI